MSDAHSADSRHGWTVPHEGCLSGCYWEQGGSVCGWCGERLRCICGQFMRADSIAAHVAACLVLSQIPDDEEQPTYKIGDRVVARDLPGVIVPAAQGTLPPGLWKVQFARMSLICSESDMRPA